MNRSSRRGQAISTPAVTGKKHTTTSEKCRKKRFSITSEDDLNLFEDELGPVPGSDNFSKLLISYNCTLFLYFSYTMMTVG